MRARSSKRRSSLRVLVLLAVVIIACLVLLSCSERLGFGGVATQVAVAFVIALACVIAAALLLFGKRELAARRDVYLADGVAYSPCVGTLPIQPELLLEGMVFAFAVLDSNDAPVAPPEGFEPRFVIHTEEFAYTTVGRSEAHLPDDLAVILSLRKAKRKVVCSRDVSVVNWCGTLEDLESGGCKRFTCTDELESLLESECGLFSPTIP